MRVRFLLLFLIGIVQVGCKKPYTPAIISSSESYLVVEGVINSGADSTFIKLSYTLSLEGQVLQNPVLNAIVSVQSDQNMVYPLTEKKNGEYVSAGLNLSSNQKYRLAIKTINNEQYYSDYEAVLSSPPIDSVYFTIGSNGLTINSATHDPTNTIKYYRWDYQETWIIHSNYPSYFKSDGITIVQRDFVDDDIYTCWVSDTSSAITLASTARLVKPVITDNPITSIVSTSEKLGSKYSILVRQYALTGDAYHFWTNLKKNTEQLGSIFDALPSQINGNIHSASNPSEPVIGYVSIGSVASKRIFITNQQVPAWNTVKPYPDCVLDTFLYKYVIPGTTDTINQVNQAFNYLNGAKNPSNPYIPVGPIRVTFDGIPVGYTGSTRECVDCTLRGTNKQPAFWE